jgi:hypothetical protein
LEAERPLGIPRLVVRLFATVRAAGPYPFLIAGLLRQYHRWFPTIFDILKVPVCTGIERVQLWYGTLVSETPGIVGIQVSMEARKDHILVRIVQGDKQFRLSHTLFHIGSTQICPA